MVHFTIILSTVTWLALCSSFFICPASSVVLSHPKQAEIDEYLAGLVVHRVSSEQIEYLLLKKASGDKEWQPAKGHVDLEDSSTFDAAVRETFEETGLTLNDYETFDYHLMHQYVAGDGTSKQVDMWPARVIDPNVSIILGSEHSEYTWANISTTSSLVNKRWRNEVFLPTDAYLNSLVH